MKTKSKIKDELLDERLKDYSSPEDLIGPEGLLTALKKPLIGRAHGARNERRTGAIQSISKRQLRIKKCS